jgi:hypothetical protein
VLLALNHEAVDRAAIAGQLEPTIQGFVARCHAAAATKVLVDVVDRVNGTMQISELVSLTAPAAVP